MKLLKEMRQYKTHRRIERAYSNSKKVKKEVPYKFFLRRPTRTMTDEAELYYGVKLAEGIKAGLLTKALLEKRFENDGGTRSDDENEQYHLREWTNSKS